MLTLEGPVKGFKPLTLKIEKELSTLLGCSTVSGTALFVSRFDSLEFVDFVDSIDNRVHW